MVRQGTTALTASGVFHVEPVTNTAAGCSSAAYSGGGICLRSGGITGVADRALRFDEGPFRTLLGNVNRYNLFGTASHDFGWAEAFAEVGYYHADFDGAREQSAPLSTAPISIAANAYWNPFGPTGSPNRLPNLTGVPATGLAMTITNYRPVDAGPRTYGVEDDSVRLLAGLRGDWRGWRWDTAASASAAKTDDVTHHAISNTLFQAAINRTTADAYNPFNGGNLQNFSGPDTTVSNLATINSFLVDIHRVSYTSLFTWDAKVSRPDLFHIWAGDVGMATGVEVRHETYGDHRDPRLNGTTRYTDSVTGLTYGTDVVGASGSPNVDADRTVTSGFIELAVPLVSPEMNIPLVQSIDLQIAARDEDYSDFGNVIKPKVAGIWKVFDGLSLRGSFSQGFRAPNLPQFYSDGTNVSNTRTDYAFCRLNNTTCTGVSTVEVRVGNKDLQPEEADESSVGVVFQPTFIPSRFGRFTFTIDAWNISETNVIGIEDAPTQILYDLLLRQRGSSNPAVVRLPAATGQAVGQLSFVNELYSNLQPRELSGIDYTVDWSLRGTRFGNFSAQLNAAQLTKFQQSPDDVQTQVTAANNAGAFGPGITVTSSGSPDQDQRQPPLARHWHLHLVAGPVAVGRLLPVRGAGVRHRAGAGGQPVLPRARPVPAELLRAVPVREHGPGQRHHAARGRAQPGGPRSAARRQQRRLPRSALQPIGRYWYGSLIKRF